MRTNEEIQQIIEGAFNPLHCGADIFDYGKKVRFQVFDANNQPIYAVPELVLDSVRDDNQLRVVLEQARAIVANHGYALVPWQLQ